MNNESVSAADLVGDGGTLGVFRDEFWRLTGCILVFDGVNLAF